MNKHDCINIFARHMFFETADREYLMSRLAFRNCLYQQFYWSALHSLEKYLKAILVFNRVSSKGYSHNIKDIRAKVSSIGVNILLDCDEEEFFERLVDVGQNRYLDKSWVIWGNELNLLDHIVFKIRYFCHDIKGFGKGAPLHEDDFNIALNKISASIGEALPSSYGLIEKIMNDLNSPQYEALSWLNVAFSLSEKSMGKFLIPSCENTPLFYLQDKVDLYYQDLEKLIKLPR